VIGVTTTWVDSEPCPACGAGLLIIDDGASAITWTCRACGWTVTGDLADHSGGSQ
jgi:ribosomal protein L37AE/L43A